MNVDAPPWESIGWSTRSALKNANKIGESGDPYASPICARGPISVRKSLNPILV